MTIHLAISFDQNYKKQFYALLMSILDNNKRHQIIIHAIVTGIDEAEKKSIKSFINTHNGDINFYTIDTSLVSEFALTNNWTSAVYYRLFFPHKVPADVKRLLYIDTDTLVVNDLGELFSESIAPYPIGAVYDNYVKKAPQLGINEEENYFNSGMMVIDIDTWKEQKVTENTMTFVEANPEKILFADQDGLNYTLKNNWKKLNWKYNTMYSYIPQTISKKELDEFIKDKVLLHFTLQRPWNVLCRNRYRDLYFHYLNRSPSADKTKYKDYDSKKIPQLLKIRALEFYFDHPMLQSMWRGLRKNA